MVYRSGTSGSLGPEWDVIEVILQREDRRVMRTFASVVLARNPSGDIIRKIDTPSGRWEQITDGEALQVCREFYENRDRLLSQSTQ